MVQKGRHQTVKMIINSLLYVSGTDRSGLVHIYSIYRHVRELPFCILASASNDFACCYVHVQGSAGSAVCGGKGLTPAWAPQRGGSPTIVAEAAT